METMMEPALLNYFIYNDELKDTCDFNSRFIEKGPGIYEVIRFQDGKPLFLDEHIRRFFQSAKYEKLPLELTEEQIRERIKTLIISNRAKQGNIFFELTINPEKGPVFTAWVMPSYYPSKEELTNGVVIKTMTGARKKPHSKRINLPVRKTADKIIQGEHVAEVLMISDSGLVTEGSRSNIFFVKDTALYTPPLKLVLPGITRSVIIRLARENGIKVFEEDIRFDHIQRFDSCFLTSTSRDVLPVRQIDKLRYSVSSPVIRKLISLFEDMAFEYFLNFSWD
ncbi:MAG: hypothetical protein GXO86_07750 [Chlorobi bacterium]|nr:hypothetical protein [Chlorobiota bacterium]